MKFFKAFNILHRRTKSDTFIPGYLIPQWASDLSISRPRPSSLPAGLGSTKADLPDVSSIFDFATAKFTPVPANFSHLRGVNDSSARVLSHRRTGRDSQNNIPALVVEENMRLREALNLWFQEYSNVDRLLQRCRAELAFERNKSRTLHQQTVRDQDLILNLKKDLSRYERRFEKFGFSDHCNHDQSSIPSTLLLPASSNSGSSLAISRKLRTLDDYGSALRMTISTRRQLRDQKKISKFWKNTAFNTGKFEDLITPSASKISSVHEPLPLERKTAVESLMQQRGWPYPLVNPEKPVDKRLSDLPYDTSGDWTQSRIQPVPSMATLTSSSSKTSSSRLAPLASESLKAEINMLFGVQSPAKLPSSQKRRRSGSVVLNLSSKTIKESPSRLGTILKVDSSSFGHPSCVDMSSQKIFSQDGSPGVRLPAVITKDNLVDKSTADRGSQPACSPSLIDFAIPSGSSRLFGQEAEPSDLLPTCTVQPVTAERTTKPNNMWQKYMAPTPTLTTTQSPSNMKRPAKKVIKGKENTPKISKPLSVYMKPSKIPSPTIESR